MQKKKTKFNLLDLAILLVIACSVCLLIFRDTVSEIFEEPQMVTLEVTLDVRGSDIIEQFKNAEGKSVSFEPDGDEEHYIELVYTEMKILPGSITVPDHAEFVFTCVGYKKLGRYYTESGERIYVNSESAFTLDGTRTECYTVSVEKDDLNT